MKSLHRLTLRTLRDSTDGQVLVVAILMMLPLVMFLMTVPNVTYVTAAKIRTQNAADLAAYSNAAWLARGMNFVAASNVGVLDAMLTVEALTLTLALADVMDRYNYFEGMPQAIAQHFFGTMDLTHAIDTTFPADVRRLHQSADWLADRAGIAAASAPEMANVMGGEHALSNVGPGAGRGGIAVNAAGPAELEPVPVEGMLYDQLSGYAPEDSSGTDTYGIGGALWWFLRVEENLGMSARFVWREALDSIGVYQVYSRHAVKVKMRFWRDMPDSMPDSTAYDSTGIYYLPRQEDIVRQYELGERLTQRGYSLRARGYEFQVGWRVDQPGDSSVTAYWPNGAPHRFVVGYNAGKFQELLPFVNQPEANLLREDLYRTHHYAVTGHFAWGTLDTSGRKVVAPPPLPGQVRVCRMGFSGGEPPPCAGFVWTRPGSGFLIEPRFARNLFRFGAPGSFPFIAVAKARPYFAGDEDNDSLAVYGACWDSRLEPVDEAALQLLRHEPEYANRGALDPRTMLGKVLLH
jgi:hypothetical protein